jgi:hypothetical protein
MGRKANHADQTTMQVLERIEEEDDPRMAWGVVSRRIRAMREAGREVPDALVMVERKLMTDMMAESQGR